MRGSLRMRFDAIDKREHGRPILVPLAGVIQLVECQLPKLDVAGSSPVARSQPAARRKPAVGRSSSWSLTS